LQEEVQHVGYNCEKVHVSAYTNGKDGAYEQGK
jgi:hypothetical protein